MKIVTTDLLRQLSEKARSAPRLRMNHNLHPSDDSRCHRLLNAIEPASYIRPHRHLDPEKDEAFILMSGRLGVITFGDDGEVAGTAILSRESGNLGADVPAGVFHTALSLEPGTVFYEAKAGPYLPYTEAEKAPWAPADDDPAAPAYLERLKNLFIP
jgi:cupin fold WbuC family metalloprotein